MSRWIDADALEYDTEWSEYHDGFTAYSQLAIDTAPSIDIVRCQDCKYWHEFIDAKGQGRCDADEHNPFRVSVGVSFADFYCSYGERRE